jgi:hypothetical protein
VRDGTLLLRAKIKKYVSFVCLGCDFLMRRFFEVFFGCIFHDNSLLGNAFSEKIFAGGTLLHASESSGEKSFKDVGIKSGAKLLVVCTSQSACSHIRIPAYTHSIYT